MQYFTCYELKAIGSELIWEATSRGEWVRRVEVEELQRELASCHRDLRAIRCILNGDEEMEVL